MYLGSWLLGDTLTFTMMMRFEHFLAQAAEVADEPNARFYENELFMTTPGQIDMTPLDEGPTFGYYSANVALTVANTFERGKRYDIYMEAILGGLPIGDHHSFQIGADSAVATSVIASVSAAPPTITSTVFATTDITDATTGHWKDRVVIFLSGNLKDQAKDITAYSQLTSPTRGQFTTSAFTGAPAAADKFIIV